MPKAVKRTHSARTDFREKVKKITQEYELKRLTIIEYIDSMIIGETATNLEKNQTVIDDMASEIINLK